MRGKVLDFSETSGTGLISGDDGQRYQFVRASLQGGVQAVAPGTDVDFQVENGQAASIYVVFASGDKNRILAAVLALFLGHWGVHKFYLGKTNAGIIMLLAGTIGWILVPRPSELGHRDHRVHHLPDQVRQAVLSGLRGGRPVVVLNGVRA